MIDGPGKGLLMIDALEKRFWHCVNGPVNGVA